GAILVRAGAELAAGEGARLEAPGGAGGGPNGCTGGDGGVGRIRVDRPNEVALETAPAAYVAPMLVLDAGPIVREARLEVTVRAAPGASHNLLLDGQETEPVSTDGDGLGTVEVTLIPGLNTLCVEVAPGADLTYSESQNCSTVAYIPR
ncbi:MAG TPA: hypothetical protein VKZ63_16520, partial [Kofleriaceae bacterium]|nr:hypothetical protein [Kofleriaceae bacterium]